MKSIIRDLEICIPTWNSSLFLRQCLTQIRKTCEGLNYQVLILDNQSTDETRTIAESFGCEVWEHKCSMPDALNELFKRSRGHRTLFMHADTILLHSDWFSLADKHLTDHCILVSPQDIGCGPYTRPMGKDKPESSFMLFDTARLRKSRSIRLVQRFRFPWFPQRIINFYSESVTQYIPAELDKRGYQWKSMQVHVSSSTIDPIYDSSRVVPGQCWDDSLSTLHYGLGNFYSIDGVITHYHNWYDRILGGHPDCKEKSGIPVEYIAERTRQFLHDFEANQVVIPTQPSAEQEPRLIPVVAGAA